MDIKDVITPLGYIIINNNRIKFMKYSWNYLFLVKCKSKFDRRIFICIQFKINHTLALHNLNTISFRKNVFIEMYLHLEY